MPTLEVLVDAGLGPVLLKRATTPDDGDRLAHEAAVLRLLAGHSGVVQLVSHVGRRSETELRLRWVGPHTLATIGVLPPLHVAGLIAALTETVADLHRAGVIHTRLTPDHVLLGPGGRPVVCGLAAAGGPNRCSPAGDVAALGALLQGLLAGEDYNGEPIPERRRWIGRRRWSGYQRQSLLMLADQATADEHASRPTARALAEAIKTAVPEATLPAPAPLGPDNASPTALDDEPRSASADTFTADASAGVDTPAPPASRPLPPLAEQHDPLPERVRRAIPVLATVVAITLVLIGFQQLIGNRTSSPGARPVERAQPEQLPSTAATGPRAGATSPTSANSSIPSTTGRPTPLTEPPSSTTSSSAEPLEQPRRLPCAPAPPPAADVDGDGCLDPYRISGGQLTAAGVTYQVGRTGDVLSVGDWDCDGQATPALLRTRTGEVFIFERWATEDRDLTVRPVSTVLGGTGLQTEDADDDGCPELTVERGSDDPETIAAGGGG